MFISLPAFTSAIAMVTPYASNASCGVTSQAASVAAAVCRNPAGAPVDTRYVVLYLTSGVLLAPTATLSGTSLTFAPQTIGTASAPQTVTLTNSGNTQLSFNSIFIIGANASDFSQAGTCPGLLGAPLAAGASCTYTFTFTPSAAGPRTASFRIANNAPDSPQTVTLTGTGQTPPPTVSPGTVTLSAAAGGGPVSQSVTLSIATAGATPPTWSAFPNSPWLSVSPASGTMAATGPPAGGLTTWAATFNINANPAGNSAGAILFGSVALSIGGNPAAVPVAFTVTAPGTLTLSPTSLPFTWRAGDTTLPAPLNVAVTSQPPGIAISATASTTSGGNWLAVSSAATTPGTLSVSVVGAVLTTLAPGTYQGSVSVASPGAPTVTLAVTLTVTSGNGALTFSPPSVSFGWRAGTPLPASVNAAITSQPSGLALTVTSSTSSGGNWLTASGATTTPGTVTVSLVSGVVTALTPGTYSGSVNVASPGAAALALPVTLTVTATSAPTIIQSGVVPVFGTSTTIQPGSWISIFGTNLAPSTLVWNLDFPTSLNGVSVTINGKNGYLWFVSPTQINLQAPDDTQTGPVPVVVTTPTGTATSTVTLAPISPSLSLLDATHVAALTVYPNGTYTIVGPVGAFPYATTPAPAGSTLVLYGVGFGPTTAPVAAGKQPDSQVQTTNQVTVTVGGTPAPVLFSGLVAAGLYQINVTVPQGLPAGDQPVVATVAGLSTRAGTVVTIQ